MDSETTPITMHMATGPRARHSRHSISRMFCIAIAAGASTIALWTAALYSMEAAQRQDAVDETARLAANLSHVREAAQQESRRTDALIITLRGKIAELQSTATGAAVSKTDGDAALQAELDKARKELADASAENGRLSESLHRQETQLHERDGELAAVPELKAALEAANGRQRELQSACAELQGQIRSLKDELLIAAAQSADNSDAKTDEDAPLPAAPETRWALGISYDNAKGFAALCFDRDSIHDTAAPQAGLRRTSATRAASAALYRFTADNARQRQARVYDAAITVSLAGDGPRDRLIENTKLVQLFLHTFAPAFRDPDAWLTNAVKQLAGHDSSDRIVLLDTTFKLTAYNDGHGTFTFLVQSPHDDLEQ